MSLLPDGRYVAKAISYDFEKTKGKGTDYIRAIFQIQEGECKGRQITWRGYLTDAASERTIAALRACGFTGTSDELDEMPGFGTANVQIVVDQEEYEGKRYNRVKFINRISSKGTQKSEQSLSEDEIAVLKAKLKDAFAMNPADEAVKGELAPATKIGWGAEDELGF
jgi:hypothetical protein